jgi:Phage portal protein, SPP1 Gp6-like
MINRRAIIDYVKSQQHFLSQVDEIFDIYDGNLRPYIDKILKESLSERYYCAIKDRILPINILQRFANKIATTYSKPPMRETSNEDHKAFLEFYENAFSINNSGMLADIYSSLAKGFAWEPYIDAKGNPAMRELAFNRFLVMSESSVSPEEETVFIKIMGRKGSTDDSILLHVYTDTEFDAFYMGGETSVEHLIENQGVNLYGVIPFVYGKRQKHKLMPTLDSDMLSITKAISVMLSDMSGALMFSCFPVMYGIDINAENMTLTPNAFWSLKSDKDSEKTPTVGVLQPTADSQKVLEFVMNIFILWLETKGIRTGSVGNIQGGSVASGISKIIDEMDAYEVKKKSMEWFKKDEEELWNEKLPLIHNYWIKSGMVDAKLVPPLVVGTVEVEVEFEKPTPMLSRTEEIANVKAELDIGTITQEMAIKILHPDYNEDVVSEMIEANDMSIKGIIDGMGKNNNTIAE